MDRQEIAALYARGEPAARVRVCGWARSIRAGGRVAFVRLYDGSCFDDLQVVLTREQTDGFEFAAAQTTGCAFEAEGALVLTPDRPQPLELRAERITVVGASSPDYPLQKKRHSMEFLRSIAHLRARTNALGAVFRIRSAAALAIHHFFSEQGFVYVHTPLITASDCEGAGAQFRVTTLDPLSPPLTADGQVDFSADFFGRPASLTVSGQLEGECLAMALGKIYTFGPTFRAERSNTPRHAAEFWMIEPEMAFCGLREDMDLARHMLQSVLKDVLRACPKELAFCNERFDSGLLARLQAASEAEFAEITYTEAIRLLRESGKDFSYPAAWGCDLQTEHERYLSETVFGGPVFVTDYPKDIKAFYMRQNDDGKTVAAVDLLLPGVGELIGGSQREERLDVLLPRMDALGLDAEGYQWYLDLRRFGSVPHAGFGLGFERLLLYLTGIGNIRDVIPFPRTTGSCEF